ncbi:hypothetical protein Tsubulata_017600 [Turnera subulata]|uniref:E2 ubiquitin-conjugating enzyme n=1 Tax=Turnera subulata TaxID=218843 RepID=A0A9Q0F3T2_9ROSI|nr:hypothetical protein Tsubulata_017600 [Turnera subulata]
MDLNVSSLPKKHKQDDQVVPCDAMEVDGVIGGGGNSILGVNKDASPSDVLGSSVVGSLDSAEDHSDNNVKNNNNDSMNSDNDDGDVENEDEMGYEDDYYGDDGSDYCGIDDEYLYEDNDDDDDDDDGDGDDYLKMQSQFDNLPAGVEVSVSLPWLNNSAPAGNSSSGASSSSAAPNHSGSETKATPLASAVTNKEPCPGPSETKSQEGTSRGGGAEEIIRKWKDFKQFDTVEDFSDHHFKGLGFTDSVPPKNWAKRIQEEWKILEKDLPDTISVRVYESRMELLRAVIGGPAGTPYHDGLFVFDCLFPASYPNQPPTVYYYSGGLRLNPNLYECGKVCLSLLGTWTGDSNENWIPGKSTMLQVLVSIQALILNERPFFNEPGYAQSYTGARGQQQSQVYSEEAFILSLKTMMYTLRRPPKYFEDLVLGHFHSRGRDVLAACKAYMGGATVATVRVKDGVAQVNNMDASNVFKTSVKQMVNALVTNFTRYASVECEDFRIEG